jgi:hypothetical protein
MATFATAFTNVIPFYVNGNVQQLGTDGVSTYMNLAKVSMVSDIGGETSPMNDLVIPNA